MSKITQISLQIKNNKRCNLFLDGEFFSGISMEVVVKHRLRVGQEIDERALKELIDESERTEALSKAADYISSRLKTKKEIKDYLVKKGYSEEIAWYCVDKLKEYNYVNDREYSKRYIESTSKHQGKRLVQYKLMMKGVKKEDIDSAYENTEVDSKSNAYQIAIKHIKNKEVTRENLSKTYRYLIGKGFSYEDASFAINKIKGENDGEDFNV